MRILSYNVNGIRSAMNKGLSDWIKAANPDILCLQEIKAMSEQFPIQEMNAMGYTAYLFPAEKKGYSGVAILSRIPAVSVQYGMGIPKYDSEGRYIQINFHEFSVASVYFPSGTSGEDRQAFKYDFLDDFRQFAQKQKDEGLQLIYCGDVNICHTEIDIHNPIANRNSTGFLPEERAWITSLLEMGFVDTFRHMHPEALHQYTWWSYRSGARKRNLGWRIDYQLINRTLLPKLERARILSEAVHSDHCPTLTEFSLTC
jgi:exodeoxyribonuclease-3